MMGMLLVAYPFVVFIGLQHIEPRWLSIILLGIVFCRLQLSKNLVSKMPWLPIAALLGAVLLLFSAMMNGEIGILLYPVAVNLAMLFAFGYSLYKKPCVIETFARISEPELDEHAVKYTEKVTMVWCVFFIINGLISIYTALILSKETWVLYNGLIAYIAMGALFAIEWLVRQYIKKQKNHV